MDYDQQAFFSFLGVHSYLLPNATSGLRPSEKQNHFLFAIQMTLTAANPAVGPATICKKLSAFIPSFKRRYYPLHCVLSPLM